MTDASAPPGPFAEGGGPEPLAVYTRMAWVLRVGLVLALALLGGALVALVVRSPHQDAGAWVRSDPFAPYFELANLGPGLAAGAPGAFLTLGVLVLIATPVVRVVTGIYYFLGRRERALAAIATVVLVLLIVGLVVFGPWVR